MSLEIRKPELVARVNAHIQAGFRDADAVMERALDALEGKAVAPLSPVERPGMSNNVKTIIFWLVVICTAVLLWAVVRK